MRVEFSAEAQADLEEIGAYIAQDSAAAAEEWIDRLVDRALAAGHVPLAGRVVPELGDSAIREVRLRAYRIIYRVETRRMVVLTIIEGHRRLMR